MVMEATRGTRTAATSAASSGGEPPSWPAILEGLHDLDEDTTEVPVIEPDEAQEIPARHAPSPSH
jgi:hypothetical protein